MNRTSLFDWLLFAAAFACLGGFAYLVFPPAVLLVAFAALLLTDISR